MSNLEKATEYKNLGNTAFQANNFQEALDYFSKAIECNPSDHVFYSNRSGCYAKLNDYKQALADAEKCVSLKPDWPRGYQRLGLAHFYLNDYKNATQAYEKGLQIDPNNTPLKEGLQQAKEASEQNNFAQQMLGKLMLNPETREYMKDPTFMQKLQMIQANPQMMTMFMSDPKMQKAIQVMFGLPEGFNFNGAPGGPGGEEGEFGEGFKEENGHGHEHEHGAGCSHDHEHEHKHENKPEPPKEKHQEKKTENNAEHFKNLGNDEYKKKNFEKAVEFYDKAIELDSNEVLYYNNKAACFIEMNQYENALEIVDKALQIAEETRLKDFVKMAKLYARKASIYQKMKDYANAIIFYDKSLLENTDNKVKDELRKVQKLKKDYEELSYINPEKAEEHNSLGRDLFTQGRFPEALKEYDEAIRRNPKDAKLHSNKSACLVKLMDFPGALRSIDKCLELDPDFKKAYGRKGTIHFSLKEYHKAIDSYEKGLKLDAENVECKEGLAKVRAAMYSHTESKETADERARHAMADPEIQRILQNPNIMNILRNIQENPNNPENLKALRDPEIAKSVNKLMEAGILKMG